MFEITHILKSLFIPFQAADVMSVSVLQTIKHSPNREVFRFSQSVQDYSNLLLTSL